MNVSRNGWKIITIALLVYVVIAGLLNDVPRLPILNETIRNLYFHVCMWMGMMVLFSISFYYSIRFLRNNNLEDDIRAQHFAGVGSYYGILGYLTGFYG